MRSSNTDEWHAIVGSRGRDCRTMHKSRAAADNLAEVTLKQAVAF